MFTAKFNYDLHITLLSLNLFVYLFPNCSYFFALFYCFQCRLEVVWSKENIKQ